MNGLTLQTNRAALIRREGELLTVTRRAATMGGTPATQSVYFLVQPVGKDESLPLQIEGTINAANNSTQRFICSGAENVVEALDSITYSGETYDLVQVTPHRRQGVSLALHCIGVRRRGS